MFQRLPPLSRSGQYCTMLLDKLYGFRVCTNWNVGQVNKMVAEFALHQLECGPGLGRHVCIGLVWRNDVGVHVGCVRMNSIW